MVNACYSWHSRSNGQSWWDCEVWGNDYTRLSGLLEHNLQYGLYVSPIKGNDASKSFQSLPLLRLDFAICCNINQIQVFQWLWFWSFRITLYKDEGRRFHQGLYMKHSLYPWIVCHILWFNLFCITLIFYTDRFLTSITLAIQ